MSPYFIYGYLIIHVAHRICIPIPIPKESSPALRDKGSAESAGESHTETPHAQRSQSHGFCCQHLMLAATNTDNERTALALTSTSTTVTPNVGKRSSLDLLCCLESPPSTLKPEHSGRFLKQHCQLQSAAAFKTLDQQACCIS